MQQQGFALLGLAIALVVLGLALVRTSLAAAPKPRPRLARWSLAGAFVCFFVAVEILVCGLLPGACSGWWPLGIGGAVVFVALLTSLWLELRQLRRRRAEVGQSQEGERECKRTARIREVAGQLRNHLDELDGLYREARDDPSESAFERERRAADRTDEYLVDWKIDLLDYLDANIGMEAVIQFHGLGTTMESGKPGEHAQSAYEAHRQALQRLLARIKQGKVRLKNPPESSGDLLPTVKSFVFPQKL